MTNPIPIQEFNIIHQLPKQEFREFQNISILGNPTTPTCTITKQPPKPPPPSPQSEPIYNQLNNNNNHVDIKPPTYDTINTTFYPQPPVLQQHFSNNSTSTYYPEHSASYNVSGTFVCKFLCAILKCLFSDCRFDPLNNTFQFNSGISNNNNNNINNINMVNTFNAFSGDSNGISGDCTYCHCIYMVLIDGKYEDDLMKILQEKLYGNY